MLRLLQLLFVGHVHKWKRDETVNLMDYDMSMKVPVGRIVYCTCETCGLPKRFRLAGR